MQFDQQSSDKNVDNLIIMDDDVNDIKLEDKNNNNNHYIPSGNPISDDNNANQFNNNVKNANNIAT